MGSKLFVGSLAWETDDASLRAAFEAHGEVVEATVIMDRETGRSRGFGFVTMSSDAAADAARQAMDGATVNGRRIRVNSAEERSSRPRGPGGPRSGPPGGSPGRSFDPSQRRPPSSSRDSGGRPPGRPSGGGGRPGGGGGGWGGPPGPDAAGEDWSMDRQDRRRRGRWEDRGDKDGDTRDGGRGGKRRGGGGRRGRDDDWGDWED